MFDKLSLFSHYRSVGMWASSNAPGSVQAKEKERKKVKKKLKKINMLYVTAQLITSTQLIKLQFNFLKYKF